MGTGDSRSVTGSSSEVLNENLGHTRVRKRDRERDRGFLMKRKPDPCIKWETDQVRVNGFYLEGNSFSQYFKISVGIFHPDIGQYIATCPIYRPTPKKMVSSKKNPLTILFLHKKRYTGR